MIRMSHVLKLFVLCLMKLAILVVFSVILVMFFLMTVRLICMNLSMTLISVVLELVFLLLILNSFVMKLQVLVACEESQAVANAFRRLGYDAFSCDLQQCSGGHPEYHIISDVLPLMNGNCFFVTENGDYHSLYGRWNLLICHPPCTYLSKVNAPLMFPNGKVNVERYNKMIEAARFFKACLAADCDYIAVENPVPLHAAGLPKPTQYIEPCWFGHPYTKRTCLWLKNLPFLMDTHAAYSVVKSWTRTTGTAYKRSKTFEGIAAAMADQWSKAIVSDYEKKLYNLHIV